MIHVVEDHAAHYCRMAREIIIVSGSAFWLIIGVTGTDGTPQRFQENCPVFGAT